jgi:hypothetical protein
MAKSDRAKRRASQRLNDKAVLAKEAKNHRTSATHHSKAARRRQFYYSVGACLLLIILLLRFVKHFK